MDNINNFKVKELRVLLFYHLWPEKYKGFTNKVELVEDFTGLFIKYWNSPVQRWGVGSSECLVKSKVGGMSVVMNEFGHEAGKYMV